MHNVLAQNLTLPGGEIEGPKGLLSGQSFTIGGVINSAIPIVFTIAGVGLFVMILMAGFEFLTSAGDAKKMESGKAKLTNAFIGFILVFSSFWIVQIFGTMFGLESITNVFPAR